MEPRLSARQGFAMLREYIQFLAPAMSPIPEIQTIKAVLRKAEKEGLDPKTVYQAASDSRPARYPAPPESDIFPL